MWTRDKMRTLWTLKSVLAMLAIIRIENEIYQFGPNALGPITSLR